MSLACFFGPACSSLLRVGRCLCREVIMSSPRRVYTHYHSIREPTTYGLSRHKSQASIAKEVFGEVKGTAQHQGSQGFLSKGCNHEWPASSHPRSGVRPTACYLERMGLSTRGSAINGWSRETRHGQLGTTTWPRRAPYARRPSMGSLYCLTE